MNDRVEQIYKLLEQSRMAALNVSQSLDKVIKALLLAREGVSLEVLADVLTRLGELQAAVQFAKPVVSERDFSACMASLTEALQLHQTTIGVDAELTRKLHIMVGDIYVEQALEYQESLLLLALREYQQALSAAQRKVVGNDLTEVMQYSARVASVLQQLGRYEDAFWLSKTTESIDRLAQVARAEALARQGVPLQPQLQKASKPE